MTALRDTVSTVDVLGKAAVVVGLTVSSALSITVVTLLSFYGVKAIKQASRDRAEEPVPTDSRHVGAAILVPAGVTAGFLAAGGGLLAIVIAALLTAPVGVALAVLAVPPWRDHNHGSWVGGAMFLSLAAVALGAAAWVRVA